MRDMIRQIVSAYQSIRLEGQGDGYVLFVGKEPGSKQPVSIKVLARTLGKDPQIAARFRALSQTIRQLNHPNIAAIRDVGEKAGLPYLVTRAIERAKPLTDRLNQPLRRVKCTLTSSSDSNGLTVALRSRPRDDRARPLRAGVRRRGILRAQADSDRRSGSRALRFRRAERRPG